MTDPRLDYISKVYSALKDNVSGFNKTPADFLDSMNNPNYRSKVYSALKDNVQGFNKSQQDFESVTAQKKNSLPTSIPKYVAAPEDLGSSSDSAPSQSQSASVPQSSSQEDSQTQPAQQQKPQPFDPKTFMRQTRAAVINQPQDNTIAVQPKEAVEAEYNKEHIPEWNKQKSDYKEKVIKATPDAITNAAINSLKIKGIDPNNAALLDKEKQNFQQQVDNGDATVGFDKNGTPGLIQNPGFWSSFHSHLMDAINENKNAREFHNMSDAEKVQFANKELTEKPSAYIGVKPTQLGSVGALGGGLLPTLGLYAAGAAAGGALESLAPETGGLSNLALKPVMSFVTNAGSEANKGEMNGVIQRYAQIKSHYPDLSDEEAMTEAKKGADVDRLAGIGQAALFSETGGVLGKSVTRNFIKEAAKSGADIGAKSAIVEGAKDVGHNLEGVTNKSASDILRDMGNAFAENAPMGTLLHAFMGVATGIAKAPALIKSALKYDISTKIPPEEVTAELEKNVQSGAISPEDANKAEADLNQFRTTLQTVPSYLSDEAKASVTGLIIKRDNLLAQSKGLDKTAQDLSKQQTDAINNQIQNIYRTGKPLEFETNPATGQTYEKPTYDDVAQQDVKNLANNIASGKPITKPEDLQTQANFPDQLKAELQNRLKEDKQAGKENSGAQQNINFFLKDKQPTIQSAVITINGKTYEGKNHAEAILKAKQDGQDISQVDRQGQGQFKLSDGTIISRDEAKQRFGQDKAELLIPQDEEAKQADKQYREITTPSKEEPAPVRAAEIPAEPVSSPVISDSKDAVTAQEQQPSIDNLKNDTNEDITNSKEGEQEIQTVHPVAVKVGTGQATTDNAAPIGFTEAKDLNKMFTDLKSKYGDKKGSALYEAANRLVNPNENTIAEIRSNGVVVKEGDKYTLKPFGNTDASPKKWTLYDKGLDVTDQFSKPTNAKENAVNSGKEIEPHKEVKTDFNTVAKELNLTDAEKLVYHELKDVPKEDRDIALDNLEVRSTDEVKGEIKDLQDEHDSIDSEIENVNESDKTDKQKSNAIKKLTKKQAQIQKLIEDAKSEKTLKNPRDLYGFDAETANELIDKINARIKTRETVKAGSDLFPEDANIPELVSIKKELKKSIDDNTIAHFEQRTADEIEKSEPTIKDIESKASSDNEAELNEAIQQADKLLSKRPSDLRGSSEDKPKPDEGKPENTKGKVGKYAAKAKELAKKVREADIPSWLINDDPNIKTSGVSGAALKEALATSIEKVGELLDKGVELKDAIAEGAKDILDKLKDIHGELSKDFQDKVIAGFSKEAENKFGKEQPKEPNEQEGKSGTLGISHEALNDLAQKIGLPEIERGKSYDPKELADRGRKLLNAGADPNKIADHFYSNGQTDENGVSVIRAKIEQLFKNGEQITDKDGTSFKENFDQLSKFMQVEKDMGTFAHRVIKSFQGQRDIDTDSFVYVSMAAQRKLGRELNKEEKAKIDGLTKQVSNLKNKVNEYEERLKNAIDKDLTGESKPEVKLSISEKAKKLADAIRRGKAHKPGVFSAATPASLVWDAAVETTAQVVERGGELINAIQKGVEYIKRTDWYKGLSEDKKKEAEDAFIKAHRDSEGTSLESLQEMLADKKGDKFTTQEAKAIWDYAKKQYLNTGSDYLQMLSGVANDLGYTMTQISKAIITPKTQRISDEMWKQRSELSKNRASVKRWLDNKGGNLAYKGFKTAINTFREAAVFGHGAIFIGTHAMPTFFDIPRAKYAISGFLNAYRAAYGKTGNYELMIADLKNSPNYLKAQRAGLQNNPERIGSDTEIISHHLKWFTEAGERGFNAIKILRQNLFDSHYNALPETLKQDPEVLKQIAEIVNNATGATNYKVPNWMREVTFAGGMEISRWERIVKNPPKAVGILFKAAKGNATPADKVFLRVWATRAGTIAGVYTSALIVNNAINAYLYPDDDKKRVNFFNPAKGDWFKLKFGSVVIDPTSGMGTSLRFIATLASMPFESEKYIKSHNQGDNRKNALAKKVLGYGLGKLSPGYTTIGELVLKHDYTGNTIPFSNDKPFYKSARKLTLAEYGEHKLPLPLAEGFEIYNDAAHEAGADGKIWNAYTKGLFFGGLSGFTGVRSYEDTKAAEPDKEKPTVQYYHSPD